jgi:hypothetical protein
MDCKGWSVRGRLTHVLEDVDVRTAPVFRFRPLQEGRICGLAPRNLRDTTGVTTGFRVIYG